MNSPCPRLPTTAHRSRPRCFRRGSETGRPSTTRLVADRSGHSDLRSARAFSRTCCASPSGSRPARIGVYQPGLLYQSQTTDHLHGPARRRRVGSRPPQGVDRGGEPSIPTRMCFEIARSAVSARHDPFPLSEPIVVEPRFCGS